MDENDKLLKFSFDDFLNELRKETRYHSNGGTPYRQRTSELSLEVASKTGHIMPFLNRDQSRQIVIRTLPYADKDRVDDVAKMLQVIARDLQRKSSLPDSLKDYLEQKRRDRKPTRFKRKNMRTN